MKPLRRYIACALLAWHLPGCSNFITTYPVAPATIRGQDRVILTVVDSTGTHEVRLQNPWATADSVWGVQCTTEMAGQGPPWRCPSDDRWSSPMSAVVEVRTKQSHTYASSMVTLVAVGLTAVVAVLLAEALRK